MIFLAACNPYRLMKKSRKTGAGIKRKTIMESEEESLAFKVKPPPLAMVSLMWDYQQLGETENEFYI